MTLLATVPAFDIELRALFVLGTLAIALPAGGTFLRYDALKKPRWSPSVWLYSFIWIALYILSGSAAYLVRIAGGEWIANVNRRPLILYTVLQVVLALYWISAVMQFFGFAALVIFIALTFAVIVAIQFGALSTTAAVFMALVVLWLLFVLVFQIAIAVRNSEGALRLAIGKQSTAQKQLEDRRRRLKGEARRTGFSDGPVQKV